MEKALAYLFFATLIISFGMFFYILMNTNVEKIFKKGKISEIRLAYFLISFVFATIFSSGLTKFIEAIYTIILK